MKKITATEAAKGFGQLVDDVQTGPVTVEKNGRPVAVVYSYKEAQRVEAMKEAQFDAFIQEGIKAADEGRVRPVTRELMDELKSKGSQRYKESQQ